jgi:hypothetical protein
MSAETCLFEATQEGLINNDSSQCGEFLADDFEWEMRVGTRNKQQYLDWVAGGGDPTRIEDNEVLYENEEVAVIIHTAKSSASTGQVMCFGEKRDGKFYYWRVVRTPISD